MACFEGTEQDQRVKRRQSKGKRGFRRAKQLLHGTKGLNVFRMYQIPGGATRPPKVRSQLLPGKLCEEALLVAIIDIYQPIEASARVFH